MAAPAISFMSANLVARERGWRIGAWSEGEQATNEAFAPLETFAERFASLAAHIRALGFEALDLWTAHLGPRWATAEHLAIARRALDAHGLRVASLAGGFGASPAELERACAVAAAVGAPVLGGMLDVPPDAPGVADLLRAHGVRLAVENHPGDETVTGLLARLGGADPDVVGTTVDTGWWATYGVDAAAAIEELAPCVVHVHLKDIRATGAHDTCPWGEGVVPIERCVEALARIAYTGAISIEHEPFDEDPSEACRAMRERLEGWLA